MSSFSKSNSSKSNSYPKVILGRAARQSVHNPEKLEKQAAALAEKITLPSGVEFARFDHAGKTYAISVKLVVEVELMTSRVPDVVVRSKPVADRRNGDARVLAPTPVLRRGGGIRSF
jgi:hypothetical protein